jgi:hypothetical protein
MPTAKALKSPRLALAGVGLCWALAGCQSGAAGVGDPVAPAKGSGGSPGRGGAGGSAGQAGAPGTGGAGGQAGAAPGTGGTGGTAGVGDSRSGGSGGTPSSPDAAATPNDGPTVKDGAGAGSVVPPATWKEHWFDHVQVIERVEYNDDVALYFDTDVQRAGTEWIFPAMTQLWQYAQRTYGSFGPESRLYAIFHEKKYSGGHPATYLDGHHDFRNVSDCGPGPWKSNGLQTIPSIFDLPSHESGHVIESANNGVLGSPGFPIWRDSKWIEFYQYDAYLALGWDDHAKRLFDKFTATTDNFPRAGTHWFRDWFYPLWRDHGHAQVMVKFFQLLAQHFPKRGNKPVSYARNLTWGEFIHFSSGAAGKDLKALATTAFGWPPAWDAQLAKARSDFPQITY